MKTHKHPRITLSIIRISSVLTLIVLLAVGANVLFGNPDIPRLLNYQGKLTDAHGPVTGTVSIIFSIYDESGALLWTEPHDDVPVTNGIFNVILGGTTPIPDSVLNGGERYFELTVNGEMITPRQQLVSVLFAVKAQDAETLEGHPASDFVMTTSDFVTSINSLNGDVTLAEGENVTITPSGNTLTISSTGGSSAWSLTGNAGTNPTTNFLGTTDNNALELRINNLRAMRFEPHDDCPNLIGGFNGNSVTPGIFGATISGGGGRTVENRVTAFNGTVSGGVSNTASGVCASVGGGVSNTASGQFATVGGGASNTASNRSANVDGGEHNTASGHSSTIGGGLSNEASGVSSTVPGGWQNTAQGDYSFAAGYRAKANHNGAFVWGDSTAADVASTGNNQFIARATGGTWIYSNDDLSAGVKLPAGASAWSSVSDRNLKRNIRPVDGKDILSKLAQIPISRWSYKAQDLQIEHIGPMAQDFYDAFGLGEDDKHISTIDPDGVALAAIQGLYELVQEKDAQIAELEARLAALEALVSLRAQKQEEGGHGDKSVGVSRSGDR